MSQYLSRIEGSPPKRNAVGSIPIWDAMRSKACFAPFLCKKHPQPPCTSLFEKRHTRRTVSLNTRLFTLRRCRHIFAHASVMQVSPRFGFSKKEQAF